MKKTLLIAIIVISLGAACTVCVLNSNCYNAIRLNRAVKAEDIQQVKKILETKPTCINTVPTPLPYWFYIAIDAPRPVYALEEAYRTDNVEMVRLLIDAGADVNGSEEVIPLARVYYNKRENWYEISQILIESGASINYVKRYFNGSSWDYCDHSNILEDVVQRRPGAALPGYIPESEEEVCLAFDYIMKNCDHSQVDWREVLRYSVSNDRLEIVQMLLDEHYCNINDRREDMTALMFAVRDSTPEMVQLLLDYGADKNDVDENGRTAYDLAVEENKQDIMALLKD